MTLKIGDTAPDFAADTTEGEIQFHDWIGDSWAVVSYPRTSRQCARRSSETWRRSSPSSIAVT